MFRLSRLLALSCVLCLAGCPSDPAPSAPAPAPSPASRPAETQQAPAATRGAQVYDVVCGCTLPEIARCGEYARVDGELIEIEGDLGLGAMPFCGKTGLRAKIEGAVQGGKLRATSLKLVE